MVQRIFLIVVVQVFLFSANIFGQEKRVENFSLLNRKSGFSFKSDLYYGSFLQSKKLAVNKFKKNNEVYHNFYLNPVFFPARLTPVAENYYSNSLGFFCQKEWQIEKATSIPLRFRLGSLDYTNYLECKPNTVIR